jgi:hypothetical protein
MANLLVVVGATGAQGRAVINHFQQHESSWHIRGLTRTPRSKQAIALTRTGVEIVEANLNDLESLISAFAGANFIFAYTDFAGIVKGPEVMGRFQAGELAAPIGAESYKIELQQGKNIAEAAATVSELERLVWSALPHVKRLSKGKYPQVFHFDAKAEVFEYMLGVGALKGKVSAAHMSAFVTNAITGLDLFKLRKVCITTTFFGCLPTDMPQTDDGSVLWKPPFPVDALMPYIDIEKDAGAFVHALIKAPAPTQILAVSEWCTSREWLEQWSRVTGVKSRIEQADAGEFQGDDPTGFMESVLETGQFISEFGFSGGDEMILMPEQVSATSYERDGILSVRC